MKALFRTALATACCLAALPASAGAVPAAGRTSQAAGRYGTQRLPSNGVSFTVRRGKVSRLSFPWVAKCDDPDVKGTQEPLLDRVVITDALPLRKGRFSAGGRYDFPPGTDQDADVSFTLRGTIAGRRASGTISLGAGITVSRQGLVDTCDPAHVIRWHATLGRRARNLAAPARARPRPLLTGIVAYARSRDGGATSSLFAIVPGGVRSPEALTDPPAGAADSAPAMPPSPFAMTFQRTINGVGQLYVTDPEGFFNDYSTPLGGGRITDFPQGASDPAVLGDAVTFSVGQGSDCSLWASPQFGGRQVQLTDHGGAPGCDDAPTFSPDGNRLVFRGNGQWVLLSTLGATPQPLDFGAVIPSAVAWGPGPKLAYVVPGALAVMNPDGTGKRTLLKDPGLTGRPAWSPLADQIAIAVRRAGGTTDLIAVRTAGTHPPTDITDTPGQSESDPVWVFQPPRAGGGVPGPSVHVKSQSARPHKRRRKRS